MKRLVPNHPKTRRLRLALGVELHEVIGLLNMLWWATGETAPQGDIGKWPDEEIEDMCAWRGERGKFVSALRESGWLDVSEKHRLVVHDWKDHIMDYVKKALSRQVAPDGVHVLGPLRHAEDDGWYENQRSTKAAAGGDAPDGGRVADELPPDGGQVADARRTKVGHAADKSWTRGGPGGEGRGGVGLGGDGQGGAGGGGVLRFEPRELAPPKRGSPPGRGLAAGWEIFENLAAQLRSETGLVVTPDHAADLLRMACGDGVPLVWLLRWVQDWCARKRKKAEVLSVALLLHAAREDLAAWVVSRPEWRASIPLAPSRVYCDRCGKNSFSWAGGELVPCACPPPRRQPGLEPIGAAVGLVAAR